jgi:hypothetical protein
MGIDADYKRSLDDLLKLQYELQQDGIQAALEQSRRGGHLWMLFESLYLPNMHGFTSDTWLAGSPCR